MIPPSISRPFGRPSPRPSEADLASLILRTVRLAVEGKREQGYAAVNVGCDGRKRTTLFDGSVCQTEGDVCIAVRQDGISACIDTPAQGAGLTSQSIVFTAPVCEPVTGWWIVDALGYMYRVPQTLIDAAPYWPMGADPTYGTAIALARAQTWARLMCGAALAVPLNGDGGGEWWIGGEGDWAQVFAANIGGARDRWTAVPTVGLADAGTYADVSVAGGAWIINGIAGSTGGTSHFYLYETDGGGAALVVGSEYGAAFYRDSAGLAYVAGPQGLIGSVTPPAIPDGALPVCTCLIRYGITGSTITLTAATTDRFGLAWLPVAALTTDATSWRGILLRDALAPNAGLRVVSVTLPAGGTGIVTGAVRVAYGYPFGYRMSGIGLGGPTTAAPYPRSNVVGTWQADCTGRLAGDMALVYSRRLAVEYGDGHICLEGAGITDLGDYVPTGQLDLGSGPPMDAAVGVVGLPGGEIALLGENAGDTRTGQRYRIRPAPDTAPTVVIEQQAKGAWGDDPNVWIKETDKSVDPWAGGATSFTVIGSDGAGFPGRSVDVILWETSDPSAGYAGATNVYYGTLGETVGGLTPITFIPGTVVVASTESFRYLTIVGPFAHAAWGWTAEVLEDPLDSSSPTHETALSPLTDQGASGYRLSAPSVLYSAKITIPGGPDGTVRRHLYRFAFDYGSRLVGELGPWAYLTEVGGELGGLYDRMCRRVYTYDSTEVGATAGTDPITFYDEDVSLSTAGTRPPSPLIYTGPITVEAPVSVHLLQPLNL